MITFIDTSAFYGILDRDDANHEKARDTWVELLAHETSLITTNYVLVESFALIQHRLGIAAVRAFQADILPVVLVEWVTDAIHRAAVSALLAASKRDLSLVDCVSFEIMQGTGVKTVFAFDPHFSQQGFSCIP
jgi:predicted nucleic acid-binding protein